MGAEGNSYDLRANWRSDELLGGKVIYKLYFEAYLGVYRKQPLY